MKISRINNMGSFGVYVDDVDMDHMTIDEWTELGKLFVKELVVVFRNINISKTQYADWIPKWGPLKSDIRLNFAQKYGGFVDATNPETWTGVDDDDREWLKLRAGQLEPTGDGRYLTRIYGRRDANGNPLGYFSHGEVHWHSNESSSLTFSPAAALLGWQSMEQSATCFVQTVDLYEQMSESFRSELNEMILIHKYVPGKINETEFTDSRESFHLRKAFCPTDGLETPLVCVAPNGRRGLRYTVNSCASIKGMSDKESQKIFNTLDKLVFDQNHIFEHYWTTKKDLLVFDNSVTLHKRLKGIKDRMAFRMQFDLSPLLDNAWRPWQYHPEYEQEYNLKIEKLLNIIGGDLKERFKVA